MISLNSQYFLTGYTFSLCQIYVPRGVDNAVEFNPTGCMCHPESDGSTSLYMVVEPQGTDLFGVLQGAMEHLKCCNLFDPTSYDKIADCFDIDKSGLHFKLAKNSKDRHEAIYNLLIAKHLVDSSPVDNECQLKDLLWLPLEGMHRWLSVLSLICASNYVESGTVALNSLSDMYLRTGLCIKNKVDSPSVNILAVLKNSLASIKPLFDLHLTVQVYSAKGTRDSSHLSALSVLAYLKLQSQVISTDKITSSTKSPILSMADGFSILSQKKTFKHQSSIQASPVILTKECTLV